MSNQRILEVWMISQDLSLYSSLKDDFKYLCNFRHFTNFSQAKSFSIEQSLSPQLIFSDVVNLESGEKLKSSMNDFKNCTFWGTGDAPCLETLRELYMLGMSDFMSSPISLNLFKIKLEVFIAKERMNSYPNLLQTIPKIKGITNIQYSILRTFINANFKEVSREVLQSSVWGNIVTHPKNLNVQLHLLRKRLNLFGLDISSPRPGKWKLVTQHDENSTVLLKSLEKLMGIAVDN